MFQISQQCRNAPPHTGLARKAGTFRFQGRDIFPGLTIKQTFDVLHACAVRVEPVIIRWAVWKFPCCLEAFNGEPQKGF